MSEYDDTDMTPEEFEEAVANSVPARPLYTSNRYESFIRTVVAALSPEVSQHSYANALSPTERVEAARNITDAFLVDGGFDLSEENAILVAATIAASVKTDTPPW